jgi:glycosyltransferase involved in cell wall biosynthesis
MSSFKEAVFVNPNKLIDDEAQVIFVADLFQEDYVGGAELTTAALIEESPYKIQKIRSREVNLAHLSQGANKFWLFGNFSQLNPELIPSIVANLKYSVLEYDYKYCRFRSPEKHAASAGSECSCQNELSGKIISAFYYGSQCMWWMSEKQKETYLRLFPFLSDKDNIVLSSVFSKNTLAAIQVLRSNIVEKKGWLVLGSDSWIKGTDAAKKWCVDNNKDYKIVGGVSYDKMLAHLAAAEGMVYMPPGADTCPRMVIEAKMLGCKLELNDNVQHKDEEWFSTDDLQSIHDYLYTSPTTFWNVIRHLIEKKPTISGYTTTYNCVTQGYPFEQSISSMMQFCDEVCVVDGGSTDETPEKLFQLQMENSGLDGKGREDFMLSMETGPDGIKLRDAMEKLNEISKVKVKFVARDWSHPRHAVFDGMQKAEARKMCTGDFCWQMDSDEVVHEDDSDKIVDLCAKMPSKVDLISLPVIEYWGGLDKVRADIQPWKWRLSRNQKYITHGIPVDLRVKDKNGDVYAAEGTDGCDMIHTETGERIQHLSFHNVDAERMRQLAVSGDTASLQRYEEWFNNVVNNIPGVHHYSWYDIPRKMRLYRDYWTRHWNSLYNKSLEDTAETNMMFDMPWSQVTDEMIDKRAADLKEKTGGWIWHRKWDGTCLPHIRVSRKQPSVMVK